MFRLQSILSTLTVTASLLALSAPASARECEDVKMPDSVTVDGTTLVLNGMGVREATVFNVNVYVAGLYAETKSSSAGPILDSEGPRQLVLRFLRDVDKADIVKAFDAGFASSGSSATLSAKIKKLEGMVPDAKDATTWTFTYTPAKGVEVKIGSTVKGAIEGADFFKAFLGIWLGSSPPNKGLKTGLLGGKCG